MVELHNALCGEEGQGTHSSTACLSGGGGVCYSWQGHREGVLSILAKLGQGYVPSRQRLSQMGQNLQAHVQSGVIGQASEPY